MNIWNMPLKLILVNQGHHHKIIDHVVGQKEDAFLQNSAIVLCL